MGNNISDLAVGSVFLFFTGMEAISLDASMELLSKIGVIAVLWFWLKDMRKQMQELRGEHKEQIKMLNDIFEDYKNRIDKHFDNKQ
jgi:hypothetical protein